MPARKKRKINERINTANNKKIIKPEDLHPIFRRKLTFGQRAADRVTTFCGSWTFIISLFIIMGIWMTMNIYMVLLRWDPYPFILLNFVLSTLAAIQAPIILMSQKRQAERDRITATYDYHINRKTEKEVREIQKNIQQIKTMLRKRRR